MRRRFAILVAAGVVAAGALGGCAGDQASTEPGADAAGAAAAAPAVRTLSVTVRDGKASGDTGEIAVPLGTPLVVSVSSDVADEIHVRGYDRKAIVPEGTTAAVVFTATKPGTFEVALENSKLALLQLQVN